MHIFAWQDLFIAISLLLVIEGILPFLNPSGWKKIMTMIIRQSDNILRIIGLLSMLSGVFLLYIIK